MSPIPLPYEIPGTQKPGSLEEAVQGNLDALATSIPTSGDVGQALSLGSVVMTGQYSFAYNVAAAGFQVINVPVGHTLKVGWQVMLHNVNNAASDRLNFPAVQATTGNTVLQWIVSTDVAGPVTGTIYYVIWEWG